MEIALFKILSPYVYKQISARNSDYKYVCCICEQTEGQRGGGTGWARGEGGQGGRGGEGGQNEERKLSSTPPCDYSPVAYTRTRQPLKNSLVWNKMCHSQNIKTLI